ncbi:hypothetical protein LINPERPRIM_LOCUS36447 [Linum perenne]
MRLPPWSWRRRPDRG